MSANDERAKTAYETLRAGFGKNPCPCPPWDGLEVWMRDALIVCYLQGRVDRAGELYKAQGKSQP